jgi:hypothetical protein
MHLLGTTIQEAIDWTQDRLRTTRPLAERTLFSLLADKRVRETQDGFVMVEDTDEEEMRKRFNTIKARHGRGAKFRFHQSRKKGFKHVKHFMQQLRRLDEPDATPTTVMFDADTDDVEGPE